MTTLRPTVDREGSIGYSLYRVDNNEHLGDQGETPADWDSVEGIINDVLTAILIERDKDVDVYAVVNLDFLAPAVSFEVRGVVEGSNQ